MQTLSKEAETKLLVAIEKTAAFVSDGLDPSSAIAKAAAEDSIPVGHINLMVHAYNTGRTSRQRSEGADTLEKAADFPLADASVVLEKLYPAQVKTAAAQSRSTVVSTQYALPPTGILSRREQSRVKEAGKQLDWTLQGVKGPPKPYPRDEAAAMKRAYATADRHKRAMEESRRQVTHALDKLASTFKEVTAYFRTPGCTPIPVVREQAFLLHGGKGQQLIDEIVSVTPSLAKMARHKPAVITNSLQAVDGEVYGLISQFLDELEEYNQLKTAHAQIEKDASAASEAALLPFVHAPLCILSGLPISSAIPSETEKRGNLGLLYGVSAIKNLLGNVGGGDDANPLPTDDAASGKMYNKITDPDHEAQLRNIQTQAMLQDMLINDPVISGYEPHEALNAFNDIVSTAPHAANQRLLLQSLLRKRLEQGNMDPFEADQLLGIEQKQKRLNAPPGKGLGDASVL